MKVAKVEPAFKPVTITLESLEEVISMRAIVSAARQGKTITETMRYWGRDESNGKPQPRDAQSFCERLEGDICDDRLSRQN